MTLRMGMTSKSKYTCSYLLSYASIKLSFNEQIKHKNYMSCKKKPIVRLPPLSAQGRHYQSVTQLYRQPSLIIVRSWDKTCFSSLIKGNHLVLQNDAQGQGKLSANLKMLLRFPDRYCTGHKFRERAETEASLIKTGCQQNIKNLIRISDVNFWRMLVMCLWLLV